MSSEKTSLSKILSQKEYLKKYLSKGKTKVKKRPVKRVNVKVIDDNDLTNNHFEENIDLEIGEDAPVIAAVIDERPKTIQRLEAYKTSNRWAPVPEIGGVSDKLSDQKNQADSSERDNAQDDTVSRLNSSSIESRYLREYESSSSKNRTSRTENLSTSDNGTSKNAKRLSHKDISPSPDVSDSKNHRDLSSKKYKKHDSSSPERKSNYKKRRYSSDENLSPRRTKHSKEYETTKIEKSLSSKRKSSNKKRSYSSDDDSSHRLTKYSKEYETSKIEKPRTHENSRRKSRSPDRNDLINKKKEKSGRDHSYESRDEIGKNDEKNRGSSSVKRKKDRDLPEHSSPIYESRRRNRNHENPIDSSPPHSHKVKKKKKDHCSSPKRKISKRSSSSSFSSSDQSDYKKSKRSSNKKEKYRERESRTLAASEKSRDYNKKKTTNDRHSSPITEKADKYSAGRSSSKNKNGGENHNKAAKYKNSSSSSKNESERHDHKTDIENDQKKPTAEQYYQWGKGLKQVEDENEKLAYDLHEMSKPLARYRDDEDLDKHLKYMDRDGDPFAIMKRNNEDDSTDNSKPRYKGTFPQNRFGISPGHKWDGVDRSNGYEVKWLSKSKTKEATEEEAYKWSTADM